MRAIAGYMGQEATREQRRAMLQTPRGGGLHWERLWGNASLLCSDKTGGAEVTAQGETWGLCWDGELYNGEEVRKSLLKAGIPCENANQGELILRSWIQWGPEALEMLEGVYAFAVLEKQRGRLTLVRDPMGVRPLFYGERGDGIFFGSEIKNVLTRIPAALDREGMLELILLGPGRKPGSGVFRDIREMEPGCYGVYEKGKLQLHRYWCLRADDHRDSFPETAEAVRALVTDSACQQMGPNLGAFLSGGLDSGILSALCARELRKTGGTLRTFSVDYLNNDIYFQPGKFQPDSDERYIRIMTQALPSVHRRCVLTAEDLYSHLEAAVAARDLPGMGDVDSSLLVFAGEVRKEIPAVFSGECADEIFGGYPWFRDPKIRSQAGFPWAQNTAMRASLLRKGGEEARDFVMEAYEKACRDTELPPDCPQEEAQVRRMANLNFRWFMQTLLDRNDRMSAAAGLTVRVPFCSPKIAQYLYNVPWSFKEYEGREKGLLRHAFRELLPEAVLWRKKSPYPKTFDPRYESLVMAGVEEMLRRDSPIWLLLEPGAVRSMLSREACEPWYGQLMRRPQTAAYLLQLEFWLKMYDVQLDNINL